MPTTPAPSTLSHQWQWRHQSIHYVRSGEPHAQRPPLLLIHGFGASTDHWQKNLAGLSQDFEVWAIDLLGFGRSAKPDWEYSGNLWRDQLRDFITEVVGQPVVLAGNSLGGYAALCVAAQCPDAAVGLVLLNSAGPFTETVPPPEPPFPKKMMSAVIKGLFQQEWVSFVLFHYLRQPAIIRKTLKKVYLDHSAVTEELVQNIYRPACDPGARKVFASVFKTRQGEKVDVLLSQLACPLLMLWGANDPWMKVAERSIKFRQHYPQLTEHYLEAGHCPHDEVPQQVNALIREWVQTEFNLNSDPHFI